MRMTRRQVLVGLLGLGAGAGLPAGWRTARAATKEAASPSPLPSDRRRALAAATERLLPGAIEAGVPEYLDNWLKREPFSRFVEPLFRIGAVHLDRLARAEHKKVFAACKPEAQDALLLRFQKGEVKARNFKSRLFFEHLIRFTLEGYLSDPIHGGNRDRVGWKFIGRPEGHPGCWWEPRDFDFHLNRSEGPPW